MDGPARMVFNGKICDLRSSAISGFPWLIRLQPLQHGAMTILNPEVETRLSTVADDSLPATALNACVTMIRPPQGWQLMNVRELWQFRELVYFGDFSSKPTASEGLNGLDLRQETENGPSQRL